MYARTWIADGQNPIFAGRALFFFLKVHRSAILEISVFFSNLGGKGFQKSTKIDDFPIVAMEVENSNFCKFYRPPCCALAMKPWTIFDNRCFLRLCVQKAGPSTALLDFFPYDFVIFTRKKMIFFADVFSNLIDRFEPLGGPIAIRKWLILEIEQTK